MIPPGMEHGPPRLGRGRATFVVRVFRAAAIPHPKREIAAALKTSWPMRGNREIASPSWPEPICEICGICGSTFDLEKQQAEYGLDPLEAAIHQRSDGAILEAILVFSVILPSLVTVPGEAARFHQGVPVKVRPVFLG